MQIVEEIIGLIDRQLRRFVNIRIPYSYGKHLLIEPCPMALLAFGLDHEGTVVFLAKLGLGLFETAFDQSLDAFDIAELVVGRAAGRSHGIADLFIRTVKDDVHFFLGHLV